MTIRSDITSGQPVRLVLAVLFLCWLSAAALAQQGEFTTRAKQAILIEADAGAVLFQHNADERMSPASMSKLMTLALLFKALKSGQLKPETELVMSENAWRTGGAPSGTSAMMVPVNTRATVNDLMQGIIVQSGNDAAISIAEGLAGSESEFARLMTEEGRRIGLKNSTFVNATGLYHPDHLTTARDLAKLAQHIIQEYPRFYTLFAQREFQYRRHRFINRNPLLFLDIGADGLKTGYIRQSGHGIVASAKQEARRLIVVVNGLSTPEERRDEARRLLEWGFKNFTEFRLFDPGEVVGQARVYGGTRFYVPLMGSDGVHVLLPRGPANQRLRAELVYSSPLKPPIRKGDVVARLRVTNASNTVNEVPLYASEDVAQGSVWRRGLDSLAHLAFGWIR